MNENKTNAKVITVKDLWNVLRGCFIFVLLAAILATGAAYAWGKMHYVPRYSSTATIVLVGEYEGDDFDVNKFANDYNIAYRIIEECVILLNSRTVLDAVGEDVGISNGYANLRGSISTNNPEDTRVIEVTVTSDSPERAKQIVDSICKQGALAVNDLYGINNLVRIFEEGTVNNYPINGASIVSYAKYGVIAAALVYVIFFAMFLFDNYIHTEADIENYLGVKIIGDIPDANAPDKRKRKYTNYKGYDSNAYGYGGGRVNKKPNDEKDK